MHKVLLGANSACSSFSANYLASMQTFAKQNMFAQYMDVFHIICPQCGCMTITYMFIFTKSTNSAWTNVHTLTMYIFKYNLHTMHCSHITCSSPAIFATVDIAWDQL